MKLSIETLRLILDVVEVVDVPDGIEFDRLNIARIREFDTWPNEGNELYFVVYEDDPDREGWYLHSFDRSLNISTIKSRENITFVVDDRVPETARNGLRYIRVTNVFRAIEQIREHTLSLFKPIVVGVTGSVGKTTTVALIQSVLSSRLECGRVYSKRITPLILSSWLANYLNPSHQVLALEYSMYRPHHISTLADILKPNIAVLMNVKEVYLGVAGVNTLHDILSSKAPLVERAETSVLNADDHLVASLKRKGDYTFSLTLKDADAFVEHEGNKMNIRLNLTGEVIGFRPYLKTNLFCYQAMAAALVGAHLGISGEEISEALNQFRPAENRIGWITLKGEHVLFDGDVSSAGRMSALAENRYASPILLVASFDFGEEDVTLQIDYFSEVFGRFNEVRILDIEENRLMLSRYGFRNCNLVPREQFLDNMSNFDFRVLHFGTYFRRHKDMGHLFVLIGA
jgi:UDP-N-acetylmuramyl pentapeptide synthase